MKLKLSLVVIPFLVLSQCGLAQKQVKGSGNVTKQTRELASFEEIEVGGAFEVELKKSSSNSIILELDDNIHELIETQVSGRALKIGTKNGYNLQKTTKMKLTINYTKLNQLDVSGACNLISLDVIESEDFICELSGAGKIELNVKCKRFNSDVSGAGSIKVRGQSDFQRLDLSGASSYNAYELVTSETVVHASGAASAKVNCSKKLDAHASGASSVRFKGKPESKEIHKSGAASIEDID